MCILPLVCFLKKKKKQNLKQKKKSLISLSLYLSIYILTFLFFILILESLIFFYKLILLKTKNWKHCKKIIFKCMNSAVWSIFNENFVEKKDLWVMWTVHEIHWKIHFTCWNTFLKKKQNKNMQNPDAGDPLTNTF